MRPKLDFHIIAQNVASNLEDALYMVEDCELLESIEVIEAVYELSEDLRTRLYRLRTDHEARKDADE